MTAMTTTTRLTCTTCELEIAGPAEFHVGLPFCCAGCVVGGPCLCSYDVLEDARSVADAAGPLAVEPAVPDADRSVAGVGGSGGHVPHLRRRILRR